jgi:chromosome segregation ATPase
MLNEQLQLAIHNQEKETQETVQALQRKLEVAETNYEILKHDHASAKAQVIMEGNEEVKNVQKKLDALERKHVELKQNHKKLETAHKQLEKDLEMAHTQLNAAVTMAEENQKQLDQRTCASEETITLRKDLHKLKLENQQLKVIRISILLFLYLTLWFSFKWNN